MVRQGIETDDAVKARIRELARAKLKPVHIAVEVRCSVQTVYKYAGDIIAEIRQQLPGVPQDHAA